MTAHIKNHLPPQCLTMTGHKVLSLLCSVFNKHMKDTGCNTISNCSCQTCWLHKICSPQPQWTYPVWPITRTYCKESKLTGRNTNECKVWRQGSSDETNWTWSYRNRTIWMHKLLHWHLCYIKKLVWISTHNQAYFYAQYCTSIWWQALTLDCNSKGFLCMIIEQEAFKTETDWLLV